MITILKKLTLTLKIIPLILIGTFLSVFIGSSLLLSQFEEISTKQIMQSRDLLNNEKNISKDIQANALESKAHTLGIFMSSVAVDLILSSDFESLLMYRDNALKDPDIAYATFLNTNLKPLIEYDITHNKDTIIEKKFSIESEGESLGYVLLGISNKRMNSAFKESDDRIRLALTSVQENSDDAYNNFYYILSMMVFGIIISVIVTVYFTFKKLIVTKLQNTTQLMNKLSQGSGDLTKRLPTENQDEISMLCVSVNEFIVTLQEMVLSISSNIDQLTNESNLLEEEGQALSHHAYSQAEEASITASSMTEMMASVKNVVLSSENAEDIAKMANVEAKKGASVIVETIKSINSLSLEIIESSKVVFSLQEESKNIGGVLDVIRGIAEQTNLLALNAAIEAARAGDQGRGFAVVADEVRTLASRTQSATEEINKMIESLQSGSEDAVSAMSNSKISAESAVKQSLLADTSLKNIVEKMSTISDMNFQIKQSAEEQRQVVESVEQSVVKINDTSHETAETAKKTALISKNLSSLAKGLKEMVGQFEA